MGCVGHYGESLEFKGARGVQRRKGKEIAIDCQLGELDGLLSRLWEGVGGEDFEYEALEKWKLGTEELRLLIFSIG